MNVSYFIQECPTCGRRLRIRVAYLGKRVVCEHCLGSLVARDLSSTNYISSDSSEAILRRAEELLQSSEQPEMVMHTIHPR